MYFLSCLFINLCWNTIFCTIITGTVSLHRGALIYVFTVVLLFPINTDLRKTPFYKISDVFRETCVWNIQPLFVRSRNELGVFSSTALQSPSYIIVHWYQLFCRKGCENTTTAGLHYWHVVSALYRSVVVRWSCQQPSLGWVIVALIIPQ